MRLVGDGVIVNLHHGRQKEEVLCNVMCRLVIQMHFKRTMVSRSVNGGVFRQYRDFFFAIRLM